MAKNEVLKVSEERWQKAQQWEAALWSSYTTKHPYLKILAKFIKGLAKPKLLYDMIKYRDFYCGDDWNYWWKNAFENYKALPKFFEKALEVGCGPYTNMRLISKHCKIQDIYCSDPLMDVYASFKLNWLAKKIKTKQIKLSSDRCECLNFPDNYFDLVICINVLDHVQDAKKCLEEIIRVAKSNGFLILGQDLSNDDDLKIEAVIRDIGHPIKITHDTIDNVLGSKFKPCLKKIIPREKGRNPKAHYGTYIFIGQKRLKNE